MKQLLPLFLINILRNFIYEKNHRKQYKQWLKNGKGLPQPHLEKRKILKEHINHTYQIFIETGTYRGDMIYGMKKYFRKLVSIELSQKLYEKAMSRFIHNKKVTIYQGDSGIVLEKIMKNINEPVVFWLDGHYSGGGTAMGSLQCPIFSELKLILNSKHNHQIFIDDARCFNGTDDYPKVVELKEFILTKNSEAKFEILNDIFLIQL
jgi:hypothetical protein